MQLKPVGRAVPPARTKPLRRGEGPSAPLRVIGECVRKTDSTLKGKEVSLIACLVWFEQDPQNGGLGQPALPVSTDLFRRGGDATTEPLFGVGLQTASFGPTRSPDRRSTLPKTGDPVARSIGARSLETDAQRR